MLARNTSTPKRTMTRLAQTETKAKTDLTQQPYVENQRRHFLTQVGFPNWF